MDKTNIIYRFFLFASLSICWKKTSGYSLHIWVSLSMPPNMTRSLKDELANFLLIIKMLQSLEEQHITTVLFFLLCAEII